MLNYWQDLHAFYAKKQEENPLYFDPEFTTFFGKKGVWQVFSYEDVAKVMSDHTTFSNGYLPKMEGNPLSDNINQLDPPRHELLRKLLTKAFSPNLIKELEPWMYKMCKELLEPVLLIGKADLVQTITSPFPSYVINKLLGIPGENNKQVEKWVQAIVGAPDPDNISEYLHKQQVAQSEMTEFFMSLFKEREHELKNDLISNLIAAEDNGTKLSIAEIFGTCMALILAGNETTSSLLANGLYTFLEDRTIFEQLLDNPQSIPSAINEVLRFRSPVESHCRIAVKDVLLKEKYIKQGDILNVWIGAANHDPKIFPNPGQFQINRNNFSKLMSFGHGVHYCIGAVLAKIEAKVVFETVLKELDSIKLEEGTQIIMSNSSIVSSVQNLPVTFTART